MSDFLENSYEGVRFNVQRYRFLYQLDFLFCNSAFEQGHLDPLRYKNALIIIIIIIIRVMRVWVGI